jgi:hypothetical protein
MKKTNIKSSVFHLIWNGYLFDKNPSLISAHQTQDSGLDWNSIIKGRKIFKDWNENFSIYTIGDSPVDYFIASGYYNVISDASKKVIQEITESEDVEFLPAKIMTVSSNQDFGSYWVMNVTNNIEALDWEQTLWKTESIPYNNEKAYSEIIKPALRFETVKNHHIFHLAVKGKTKPAVYFSSQLKDRLESARCTLGMQFSPIKVI